MLTLIFPKQLFRILILVIWQAGKHGVFVCTNQIVQGVFFPPSLYACSYTSFI